MIEFLARAYIKEEKDLLDNLPLERFEKVVELLYGAYERESRIFVFGNGGSAATATHLACDLNKGVCHGSRKRFQVICLNDNISTILAYANDHSYEDIFAEQLKNFLKADDLVIGISGSGNSGNVINAIEYANEHGAVSVALTGFDGGRLAKTAGTSILIPTNDMQKVEDLHLILTHMMMQVLCARLEGIGAR